MLRFMDNPFVFLEILVIPTRFVKIPKAIHTIFEPLGLGNVAI